jgi:hypothetical protein
MTDRRTFLKTTALAGAAAAAGVPLTTTAPLAQEAAGRRKKIANNPMQSDIFPGRSAGGASRMARSRSRCPPIPGPAGLCRHRARRGDFSTHCPAIAAEF